MIAMDLEAIRGMSVKIIKNKPRPCEERSACKRQARGLGGKVYALPLLLKLIDAAGEHDQIEQQEEIEIKLYRF